MKLSVHPYRAKCKVTQVCNGTATFKINSNYVINVEEGGGSCIMPQFCVMHIKYAPKTVYSFTFVFLSQVFLTFIGQPGNCCPAKCISFSSKRERTTSRVIIWGTLLALILRCWTLYTYDTCDAQNTKYHINISALYKGGIYILLVCATLWLFSNVNKGLIYEEWGKPQKTSGQLVSVPRLETSLEITLSQNKTNTIYKTKLHSCYIMNPDHVHVPVRVRVCACRT